MSITVNCCWCGEKNSFEIKFHGETVRVECVECKHDYYMYETENSVVTSPHADNAGA